MRRIIAVLLATAFALSGAQARIGETLPDLIEKFGNKYQVEALNNGDIAYKFVGDYNMNAILRNGVCVIEYYFSDLPLENGEPPNSYVRGVLNVEAPGRDWTEEKPSIRGDYAVRSNDGKYWAELMYKRQREGRFTWSMGVYYVPALINQPKTPAPARAGSVDLPNQPPKRDIAPSKNDCLLVATEALARMKDTAHWATIAGFTWTEGTKEIGKHAVLFYQPTAKSSVFMYDASGSYDLHTQSHDLGEIITALNQLLQIANIRVESPKWIEGNDSIKEFADAPGKSNRQPVWPSSAPTSTE